MVVDAYHAATTLRIANAAVDTNTIDAQLIGVAFVAFIRLAGYADAVDAYFVFFALWIAFGRRFTNTSARFVLAKTGIAIVA